MKPEDQKLINGWEYTTIGERIFFEYGKSPNKVKDKKGKYYLMGSSGISGRANDYTTHSPAIILGRKGTIDKPIYSVTPCWAIDTTYFVDKFPKDDSKYIFYLLNSQNLKSLNASTGVPSLSRDTLHSLRVSLPPLPEQKKIAKIISTIDLNLNVIQKKIDKTKILRRSTMQSLLSRGVSNDTYKKSNIGTIPSKWEVKRLTDVLEVKHGFQFRDHHFAKKGFPIVKIANLIDGKTVDIASVNSFLSLEASSEFKKFKLNENDILMALTGATLGKVSIYNSKSIAFQNYRVGKFQSKDTQIVNNHFVYWILQSEYIQNLVKNLVNEAAQPNIGKVDLEKMYIPVPPLKEQIKIVHLLTSIDQLIQSTERKFDQLKLIQKSVSNDLLKGRRRVKI